MQIRQFLTAAFIVFLLPLPLYAEVTVPLVNSSNQSIEVWFWNEERGRWNEQKAQLAPHGTVNVHFSGSKYYYLVARHLNQSCQYEDAILGWIDPSGLYRRDPQVKIVIDGRLVWKTKEQSYSVRVPYKETRTRERTVYSRRFVDGRWVMVPETITEEYEVTKYSMEERTRSVNVGSLLFGVEFLGSDGPILSLVRFQTIPEKGAFVAYKLIGRKAKETTKNPTDTVEEIGFGRYEMWTERKGKRTSEVKKVRIRRLEERVTIEESLTNGEIP